RVLCPGCIMRDIERPADVRQAEDLSTLASRVRQRETKNRSGQLAHVRAQAADVRAARLQCKRRGQWQQWCRQAGLSKAQAWRYARFGKVSYTKPFQSLSEEEQWRRWQVLCGNAEEEPATGPRAAAGTRGGGRRRLGGRSPGAFRKLTVREMPSARC